MVKIKKIDVMILFNERGSEMSWFLVFFVVMVLLIVFWFIATYNSLVRSKAFVKEGWSGIDVQLKRRYDLIPNLVAVVKQYSIHEKDVLEGVTKMRSISMGATSIEDKAKAEGQLTQALKTLFAVSENYPELKANQNFLLLQKDLGAIENDLQLVRRYYNGSARNYNIVVVSFPNTVVAKMTGFAQEPYFELAGEQERESPKVKF